MIVEVNGPHICSSVTVTMQGLCDIVEVLDEYFCFGQFDDVVIVAKCPRESNNFFCIDENIGKRRTALGRYMASSSAV